MEFITVLNKKEILFLFQHYNMMNDLKPEIF